MSKAELTLPKSPVLDPTAQFIKELIKQRGTLKGRLTKLSVYVNSFENQFLDRAKRAELNLRMQGAANILSEFNNVQNKLDGVLPESQDDEQLDERESFESKYYTILAQANCILDNDSNSPNANSCGNDLGNMHQSVKLPTINLPTFDGSYEQWLEFKNTYLSLVHTSNNISTIQKFHYLKSSLKGPAVLVIDSLEFTPDNYYVAWELLMNRYNNSRLLIHNHVKALFNIKNLSNESPILLRKLIDIILKNLRSLKLLGEPTEHWDTLIIYMIVSKLDNTTEREWEKYRSDLLLNERQNDCKTRVQVNDLLQFLKARADMLETLQVSHYKQGYDSKTITKTSHNNSKVHCNLSTSKSNKVIKRLCPYCKADHYLYSCQKFLDLAIDTKINFVTNNKLCKNCLRPAHTADTCKFGPCRKCNSKHNTIIHRDSGPTEERVSLLHAPAQGECSSDFYQLPQRTQAKHPLSQANGADVHCAQASLTKPVLLSTALVNITDDSGNTITCRVLLDSGSQCSFIRKSLCDQINTPLIQSIKKIQGIVNRLSIT
ncbi:unnamed protein product, partial [Brenthis ino]